jgi:hypothetical protein
MRLQRRIIPKIGEDKLLPVPSRNIWHTHSRTTVDSNVLAMLHFIRAQHPSEGDKCQSVESHLSLGPEYAVTPLFSLV